MQTKASIAALFRFMEPAAILRVHPGRCKQSFSHQVAFLPVLGTTERLLLASQDSANTHPHLKKGTFLVHQSEERKKRYLFVSDFDHTLSFNDSGFVLSDLLGVERFKERIAGLSDIHLVQQGGTRLPITARPRISLCAQGTSSRGRQAYSSERKYSNALRSPTGSRRAPV